MRKAIIGVAAAAVAATGVMWLRPAQSQVDTMKQVAPNVYFHEGDLHGHGHCNNGVIVFDDYVLVVDANFPSGAQAIIPRIKATTDKPIRFAFDTHHHGDHAYGNQVWVENGAIPVAHEGVLKEMKKYETGYFGGKPGRWEEAVKDRKDVAASKLKPPTLLFPDKLFFDDGKVRVELMHLGVAHTYGDGWAWLPKERILFSGDACVNGPYNYTGDGNIKQWIGTLDRALDLKPRIVCPGHGPSGDITVLQDQRRYFVTLIDSAKRLLDNYKNPVDAARQVDVVKAGIVKDKRIARYVGDFFAAQLEKAYVEVGGSPWPPKTAAAHSRRLAKVEHGNDHGVTLLDAPLPGQKKLVKHPR